jgi:hypothetical protein
MAFCGYTCLLHRPEVPNILATDLLCGTAVVMTTVATVGACVSSASSADARPAPTRCTEELRRVSAETPTFTEDQVDEPAQLASGIPRLNVGNAILDLWRPQSAVLTGVVDTTGRLNPCTVEVRAATHPDFRDAILIVAPRLRFTPARRGGVVVRQRVSMPWTWRPAS